MPNFLYARSPACPICGFHAKFTFVTREMLILNPPLDPKDYRTASVQLRQTFICCRRCDYTIGLEDSDPINQAAIHWANGLKEGPVAAETQPVLNTPLKTSAHKEKTQHDD